MFLRSISLAFLTFTLVACGSGGAGSDSSSENNGKAPGGLYLGYYAETPDSNNADDDPTYGAFILRLPNENGSFTGTMRFTYVGCQTEGNGIVPGDKNGQNITGTWQTVLDGIPQQGSYTGQYSTNSQSYSGTYENNARVSQRINVSRACTGYFDHYFVATYGTWEMFALEASYPSNFVINKTSIRNFSCPDLWPNINTRRLVYVLDPEISTTSGTPVLWQSFTVNSSTSISVPNTVALESGKTYVLAVAISDAASGSRLAFSSKSFIAP
jgi:hypothetical protein